jgi:WD40 repeat protein/serine/threonine protein kinase
MTGDASNADDRSRQIDAAIAEYLEALDQGAPPEMVAFIARHAAIAGELRDFLADYSAFKRDVPAAGSKSEQTSDFSDDAARSPFAIAGDAPRTLRYFGDYELLHEIARGGMGIVFKARQTSLNRLVAVKMILTGQLASPVEVDRFYAEAQAAATLEHPNIVPIFEVGQHEQHQYFSMGYVAGESLAQRLASGPLPPREAASIIAEVATAVHFAHGKGVIHRDLKPANILIDADGRPRITDFGLAKRQTDTSGLTVTGQVLGTPSYMPPEQISNSNGKIGPAADVYSLGATLYALLTGRPPFQSASAIDTLKQVLEKEPVSPREFDGSVPRDLETITLKCLEKQPSRRYESAQTLADELNRYLSGRPILARPVSRSEHCYRWCRRNPVVASLSAAAAALLVSVAIISTLAYRREAGLRKNVETQSKATAAALDAETIARQQAQRQTRVADSVRLAAQAREELSEHPQRSLLLAREAVQTTLQHNEPTLPVAEETLHNVAQQVGGIPLAGHTAPVGQMAVTADSHFLVTGGNDYTIRVWDLTKPDPSNAPTILRMLPNTEAPTHQDLHTLSLSPDSRWVVATGNFKDRGPYVWDLHAADPQNSLRIGQFETTGRWASFRSDGQWWVCAQDRFIGNRKPQINLYRLDRDPQDPLKIAFPQKEFPFQGAYIEIDAPKGYIYSLKFAGRWLLVQSKCADPVWDPATASKGSLRPVGAQELRLWDTDAPDPLKTERLIFRTNSEERNSVPWKLSGDNRWLMIQRTEAKDPNLAAQLYDLTAAADAGPHTLSVESRILAFDFSPDGHWLATCHSDESVRLWDLCKDDFEFHALNIGLFRRIGNQFRITFSANGTRLFAGGRLWTISKDPEKIPSSMRDVDDATHFRPTFSPNARWLFLESLTENSLHAWDLSKVLPAHFVLRGQEKDIQVEQVTPDGRWMISNCYNTNYFNASGDRTVARESSSQRSQRLDVDLNPRLWNLQSLGQSPDSRQLINFEIGTSFDTLAASPNNQWLIVGGLVHQGLFLYKLQTERSTWSLSDLFNHKLPQSGGIGAPLLSEELYTNVSSLADAGRYPVVISSDGHWAATGGLMKNVSLFDLTAENPAKTLIPLEGHADRICALAFAPDGQILASGSRDQTIRIWKLQRSEKPQEMATFTGHASPVGTLAFSPDGKLLATGSRDKTILVFDLTTNIAAPRKIILKGHTGSITRLTWSRDGRYVASGSADQTVRLWDLSDNDPGGTGRILCTQGSPVTALEFSCDGHWLCAGDNLWDCRQRDWQSNAPMHLSDQPEGVGVIAFSPDGGILATAQWAGTSSLISHPASDPTIQIWRLDQGPTLPQPVMLRGHRRGILAMTFSRDGKHVYSCGADGTVREWLLSVGDLLEYAGRTAGRELTGDERRNFAVAVNDSTPVVASRGANLVNLPLPNVFNDSNLNYGVPSSGVYTKFEDFYRNASNYHRLEFLAKGENAPMTYSAQKLVGTFTRIDNLKRWHFTCSLRYRSSGQTMGILNVELAPDPDENLEKQFGSPVLRYCFMPLTEGKARIRLFDGKTDWEFETHAPQWVATGIKVDSARFDIDNKAKAKEQLSRISFHRRENQSALDWTFRTLRANDDGTYANPDTGILLGFFWPCFTNLEKNGVRLDAYLCKELRKESDGTAQWYLALTRQSTDEIWMNVDNREIYRWPAITEKDAAAVPTRIQSFWQ